MKVLRTQPLDTATIDVIDQRLQHQPSQQSQSR